MAADVSSLVRVLSGYKDDQHGTKMGNDSTAAEKSTALITRDLLGGSISSSSSSSSSKLVSDAQELDLDLQVPSGWEKRLDLKVGPFSHLVSVSFSGIYTAISITYPEKGGKKEEGKILLCYMSF